MAGPKKTGVVTDEQKVDLFISFAHRKKQRGSDKKLILSQAW